MTRASQIVGLLFFVAVVVLAAYLLRPHEAAPVRSNAQTAPSVDAEPKTSPLDSGQKSAPASPPSSVSPSVDRSESLLLQGSLVSETQSTLSARLPARIVAAPVREGETVRKGQLLIQLDDADLRAQEKTALAAVTAAETQVGKARAGKIAQATKADADIATARGAMAQAQQKQKQAALAREAAQAENQADTKAAQESVAKAQLALERAQKTVRDLEELAKIGGVSRNDLQGARDQATAAQSDLQTAQAQVKRLQDGPDGVPYRVALAQKDVDAAATGVQQAQDGLQTALAAKKQVLALADQDIRAAQASVAQAQTGVGSAQQAIAAMSLRSPFDGVAANVAAHVGETAQPGLPLITLFSRAGLHAEALVPARQLASLHVGQSARLTVDTQPGHTFPLLLSEISPVAEPDGRTFRVKFRFTQPVNLRPGQSARIDLNHPLR